MGTKELTFLPSHYVLILFSWSIKCCISNLTEEISVRQIVSYVRRILWLKSDGSSEVGGHFFRFVTCRLTLTLSSSSFCNWTRNDKLVTASGSLCCSFFYISVVSVVQFCLHVRNKLETLVLENDSVLVVPVTPFWNYCFQALCGWCEQVPWRGETEQKYLSRSCRKNVSCMNTDIGLL